jgi:hypothetical protein
MTIAAVYHFEISFRSTFYAANTVAAPVSFA